MDPPTTSSSYSSQAHRNEKSVIGHQHNDDHTTETLTIATTKSPRRSNDHASPKRSPQLSKLMSKNNNNASNKPNRMITHQHTNNNHHYKSRNAAKIIKGEIHNVCLTSRSDPRYYTNSSSTSTSYNKANDGSDASVMMRRSRFEYEDCHPILMGLRNLHDLLSVMEVDGIFSLSSSLNGAGNNGKHKKNKQSQRKKNQKVKNDQQQSRAAAAALTTQINAVTFVSPFTQAVCSPDITAKTTGAALSSLHKFILYGFIGGHHDVAGSSGYSNNGSSIGLQYAGDEYGMEEGGIGLSPFPSSEGETVIGQSITLIAECIRQCSFEDYSYWNSGNNADGSSVSSGRGVFSFW